MADAVVLCYHAVSRSWEADLSVTPAMLERQVAFMLRSGWTPVTFSRAVLDPPAARTFAVTFDDAFASVRTHAVPILAQLGAPATVFAPTVGVSSGRLLWTGTDHWIDTPHASELEAMSWAELGELADSGWEIGSHTRTHPRLTELDDAALAEEVDGSREECARQLGRPVTTIAYPYGDVDERVAEFAARSGYQAGAALSSKLDRLGPHRYPRIGIYHADEWWRFRLKASRPLRALRTSPLWKALASSPG